MTDQLNGDVAPSDNEAAEAEAKMLEGIDKAFHDVVRKYGRSMFALVMNAGMAQQATMTLANYTQHARQRVELSHAISVLSSCFNQVTNAYLEKMGWSPELLSQCDRDIQLAFASKIVVPGSAEAQRIILGGH